MRPFNVQPLKFNLNGQVYEKKTDCMLYYNWTYFSKHSTNKFQEFLWKQFKKVF